MPIAESFAVLVGLISQFRAERRASSEDGFDEFLDWLEIHNREMKEQLDLNTQATIHIKALLHQEKEILKEQLEKLEVALTAFASGIEGFSELASSVNPNAILSDQAISFLKQFAESGSSRVLESRTFDGTEYIYLDVNGSIEVQEPRFMEDDLGVLAGLGLIRLDYNNNGDNIFIITRAAVKLVEDIGS